MAAIFETLYLSVIGGGVFVGLLWLVYSRDAHMWRYLARAYARPWAEPGEMRRLQSAVAYGKGVASKSYNGVLTIGRHADGVALRLMAPFSLFHDPIFIPFKDIRGWEQLWYLDGKSYELEFEQAPEVKLVMPAAQVAWLKENASGRMQISEERSPGEARPDIWYLVILVQGALGLSLLVWLLLRGFGVK